MRYALIDNSSLTSVQRLLGQIQIKNESIINSDILCLENVLQAILFYDKVLVLDDYKPEFRKQRQDFFSEFLLVSSSILPFDIIRSETEALMSGIAPRVEAGYFTDEDFKPFFDMLKMNVIFTWDMSGSAYHLTQKILEGVAGVDIDKYSSLHNAIYGELMDKSRANTRDAKENEPILVDRYGKLIESGHTVIDRAGSKKEAYVPREVSAFLDGLNWLAFRTIFYTLSAHNLGADLFLHPIRHAFQYNFLSKLNQNKFPLFRPIIDQMNRHSEDKLKEILNNSQPFIIESKLPLFVNWFAQKIGSPKEYINHALQLRQSPEFVEARRRLIDLENHVHSGEFTFRSNNLVNEVEKALESILSKYGANTKQGVSLSSLSTIYNVGTMFKPLPKAPNIDVRIKQTEFLKHLVPQKGFKAIYRSIVSDLSQVSRLGEYYEVITSEINFADEVYADRTKPEQLKYSNSKSGWKLPM